jgi:hypothetical protein
VVGRKEPPTVRSIPVGHDGPEMRSGSDYALIMPDAGSDPAARRGRLSWTSLNNRAGFAGPTDIQKNMVSIEVVMPRTAGRTSID